MGFPYYFGLFSVYKGENCCIHWCDLYVDFLAGIKIFRNRNLHPLEGVLRNHYLHVRLVIREVCSYKDCMVKMVSEEYEMSVLVEAFRT